MGACRRQRARSSTPACGATGCASRRPGVRRRGTGRRDEHGQPPRVRHHAEDRAGDSGLAMRHARFARKMLCSFEAEQHRARRSRRRCTWKRTPTGRCIMHRRRRRRGSGEMPLRHYLGPCQVIDTPLAKACAGETRVGVADVVGGLETIRSPQGAPADRVVPRLYGGTPTSPGSSRGNGRRAADRGSSPSASTRPASTRRNPRNFPRKAIFRRGIAILEGWTSPSARGLGRIYELIAPAAAAHGAATQARCVRSARDAVSRRRVTLRGRDCL